MSPIWICILSNKKSLLIKKVLPVTVAMPGLVETSPFRNVTQNMRPLLCHVTFSVILPPCLMFPLCRLDSVVVWNRVEGLTQWLFEERRSWGVPFLVVPRRHTWPLSQWHWSAACGVLLCELCYHWARLGLRPLWCCRVLMQRWLGAMYSVCGGAYRTWIAVGNLMTHCGAGYRSRYSHRAAGWSVRGIFLFSMTSRPGLVHA